VPVLRIGDGDSHMAYSWHPSRLRRTAAVDAATLKVLLVARSRPFACACACAELKSSVYSASPWSCPTPRRLRLEQTVDGSDAGKATVSVSSKIPPFCQWRSIAPGRLGGRPSPNRDPRALQMAAPRRARLIAITFSNCVRWIVGWS